MKSVTSRLVTLLVTLLVKLVSAKISYKEDTLYMAAKDRKVIRLQDFIPSGIMTTFEFEEIDPIDPNLLGAETKTPIGLSIFDSKINKYEMIEAMRNKSDNSGNETISLDDIKDINSGIEQYLLARMDKSFVLLLLSEQTNNKDSLVKPYVKKTVTSGTDDTLYSIIDGRHHFMFFERSLSGVRTMFMYYAYLDAENEKYFADRANVTLVGSATKFIPRDFNVNINFTSNKQIEVLGYHSNSFDYYDNMFFYINITLGDGGSVVSKVMKIEIEGHSSSDLEKSYTMVSAGLIEISHEKERLRIVLKSKIGQAGNLYMSTTCRMLVSEDPPVVRCVKPQPITGIRLLNDTQSRGIDFRNGQFGVITEQFLLHPVDDTFSKFKKIYLKIDKAFITTTSKSTLEFSAKTDKYIGLALGPNVENITSYYIIEYGAKDTEVFTNGSCKSRYFRLQGGNLFMTEPITKNNKETVKHMGLTFSDAYISLQGLVVRSRKAPLDPKNVQEKLRFNIVSKISGLVGQKKNFTVVLVQKAMDVVELNMPFNEVKVIRGGVISLTLKEEYFIGNDVVFNISTNTTNLNATVVRDKKHKLIFKNYNDKPNDNPPNNPSNAGNKIDFIKLLSDNLLLTSQFDDNKAQISICFISTRLNQGTNTLCELYSFVTIGSEKVVEAFLLNFDHYLLITKSYSGTSSPNTSYFARIYRLRNSSSESLSEARAVQISETVLFKSLSTNNSFICYTFSASAVITFITKKQTTDGFEIWRLKFRQLANNTYSNMTVEIKYDNSLITHLVMIVPDYTSKSYFYLGLYEMYTKFTTYQAIAKAGDTTGSLGYSLYKIKEISSDIVSVNNNSFCAGTRELISIGRKRTEENQTSKIFDELIYSVPFEVEHSVYQKMVRRLPLESLGLDQVLQYDCMGERNSLIVVAAKYTSDSTKKNITRLINYDLDLVNDPRSRVETIMDIPEGSTNGLLLTSSSNTYAFMDFMVMSNLINSSHREFTYIMQPIKQITFEIACPFSEFTSVPITMELKVNHSTDQVKKLQDLNIEVRPLDYSTDIEASNVNKLSKTIGTRELENSGILKITGHFFKARLWNTETQKEMKPQKDQKEIIILEERQKLLENFTSSNSLEVRMIDDIIVLREVTGNIEILYNKQNRSEKRELLMQCNSLMADTLSNSNKDSHFYLFLIEDITGGVIVRYREVNIANLRNKLPDKDVYSYEFNMTYDGVFKQPTSLVCGDNFYFLMHSKISNEIMLSALDRSANSRQVHSTNVTIKLSEVPLATELVCLNDDKHRNFSVGLIVIYPNQTQTFYKYKRETEFDKVKHIDLSFESKQKLYFQDVECEIGGSKTIVETKNWEVWLKCFYATRWSDDMVVNYTLIVNHETLEAKSSHVVQEVKEIKNFEVVKTIAEDKKLLLVGFNLEEQIEQRKIYVLVYNFSLDSNTFVTSYFTIENYGYIDFERFRQLIHVSNQGKIIYLDKKNHLSNAFSQVVVIDIDTLALKISNTNFNPNNISLEILDINDRPMEKISLINLFSLQKELTDLQRNNVVKWLIVAFFCSVGLLVSSVCFYMVMHRLYMRKLGFAKKLAATSTIRMSIKEARSATTTDIDLEDENSEDLINELVRDFKVELNTD